MVNWIINTLRTGFRIVLKIKVGKNNIIKWIKVCMASVLGVLLMR